MQKRNAFSPNDFLNSLLNKKAKITLCSEDILSGIKIVYLFCIGIIQSIDGYLNMSIKYMESTHKSSTITDENMNLLFVRGNNSITMIKCF